MSDEQQLNKFVDHTLLKPEATRTQVKKICDEAIKYQFASVCVNSTHAKFVADCLRGSEVKTCVVVGFPLGAMLSSAKAFEAQEAVKDGATEVDMVVNVGAVKEGRRADVENDIRSVVQSVSGHAIVKVILETCLLTNDEIVMACEVSKAAGAAFVKTSTGFSTAGATVEHVRLMREVVGASMGVKASGGVRTRDHALAMIAAGASRIGTSGGVDIVSPANANANANTPTNSDNSSSGQPQQGSRY
eukprot:c18542_g1_i1.p1 GENE.c18542_g1_i1~~c18542_g1_i1.p1  ORF type:complete len:260 (+),score=65.15 c18542_g1_i1:43-780(+)